LIDNQLLISELEPSVSGSEFIEQILQILSKLTGVESIVKIIEDVSIDLQNIDSNFGNDVSKYIAISEKLKELKTDFDIKYLFQTDVITKSNVNNLSIKVINSIEKGIVLLNKITIP